MIITPNYKEPENSISLASFGEALYIETDEGYISQDDFKPENMSKSKAFLVFDLINKSSGERLLIDYIREFKITHSPNSDTINQFLELCSVPGMCEITFTWLDKMYKFEYVKDTCSYDDAFKIIE